MGSNGLPAGSRLAQLTAVVFLQRVAELRGRVSVTAFTRGAIIPTKPLLYAGDFIYSGNKK